LQLGFLLAQKAAICRQSLARQPLATILRFAAELPFAWTRQIAAFIELQLQLSKV